MHIISTRIRLGAAQLPGVYRRYREDGYRPLEAQRFAIRDCEIDASNLDAARVRLRREETTIQHEKKV